MSWLGDYNSASLLLVGDWSRPAIAVMAVVSLGLLVLTWLDTRPLGPRRAGILLVLRALALGTALMLLVEPSVELRRVTTLPNDVAVVVDHSLSMSLPVDPATTRADVGNQAVEQLLPWWQQDSEEHRFHLFHARPELSELTSPDQGLPSTPSDGASTDLMAILSDLGTRFPREDLGGVVLISDGVDNRAMGSRVAPGQPLDAESLATIQSLGVPIHTVSVAAVEDVTDAAVADVLYDDFAFVRNAVSVRSRIRVLGIESGTIDVILRRSGDVLQTRTIILQPDTRDYEVDFEFVPELIGKEVYSVELTPPANDAVEANNRQFFVLNIIRDRIRVLQVVGRPSWDVRFLRELLKGNPNVDLISFFILRTAEDITRASNTEMSLIPFPTDELFSEQLPSFDLVIFHNFTYEPYNMRQYLPRVRDYVRGGGGLVMIGGEQSFSLGGYAGTEMAEVLPVELVPGRDLGSAADLRPFRPVLTEAGTRHPVTRLAFDQTSNSLLWRELPEVTGTNLVQRARPEATVLLEHPFVSTSEGPLPVLTGMDVGEGRTMALTIDGSWQWSFGHVGRGGNSRAYSAFWNSMIRWLIRDPELNLVRVEIPAGMVEPGQTSSGEVRVVDADYRPAAGATGTIEIHRRSLDALGGAAPSELVSSTEFTADAAGRFPIEFVPETSGEYTVTARVPSAAGELTDDELVLAVQDPEELRQVEPRPELLQQIAEASGGRFVQGAPSSLNRLPLIPPRTQDIGQRRVLQLWSSPWVLIWFALLLATEWVLRRAWGRA